MLPGKVIQIFEYGKLQVGDEGLFKPEHFERLVRYNEAHSNRYFRVGHNTIYFESYVGVLQVGNLVIEVLPKADKSDTGDKNKWHIALIRMLKACRKLHLESLTDAQLQLRSTTLLDLYFHSFLDEVEYLVHCGLIKQYRKQQGNVSSLKGRMLFQKQVSQNLVHRERFYTEHTVYDHNHLVNRILKKGLEVLASVSSRAGIASRTKRLLLDFETIDSCYPTLQQFERIPTTRKTKPYGRALLLAKMIIMNYSPDLKGGKEHILAILFKMERLFEEYVTRALQQAAPDIPGYDIRIDAQQSRNFWQDKTIRPDMVATITPADGSPMRKVIIDTKWKVLDKLAPSDADLKQMFAYNLQFNSADSILLYPKVYFDSTPPKAFHPADAASGFQHYCRLYFAEIVEDDGSLKSNFGTHFLTEALLPKPPLHTP